MFYKNKKTGQIFEITGGAALKAVKRDTETFEPVGNPEAAAGAAQGQACPGQGCQRQGRRRTTGTGRREY